MEIETASLVRLVCPALDLSLGRIGKQVLGPARNRVELCLDVQTHAAADRQKQRGQSPSWREKIV